jgi:hypothetical protein
VDRQKQRNRACADRASDGTDRRRTREQEAHRRRTNCDAADSRYAGWSSRGLASAITVATGKRGAETNFSERSKFRSTRSTRRGRESRASSTENATRCVSVACCISQVFCCDAGCTAFTSLVRCAAWKSVTSARREPDSHFTMMLMSILPNE